MLYIVHPAPYFKKISENEFIKAFVDGIMASVTGAVALLSIFSIIYVKKLKEPYIIATAGALGILIKSYSDAVDQAIHHFLLPGIVSNTDSVLNNKKISLIS